MSILEQRGVNRLNNVAVRVGFFCVEMFQDRKTGALHGHLW